MHMYLAVLAVRGLSTDSSIFITPTTSEHSNCQTTQADLLLFLASEVWDFIPSAMSTQQRGAPKPVALWKLGSVCAISAKCIEIVLLERFFSIVISGTIPNKQSIEEHAVQHCQVHLLVPRFEVSLPFWKNLHHGSSSDLFC